MKCFRLTQVWISDFYYLFPILRSSAGLFAFRKARHFLIMAKYFGTGHPIRRRISVPTASRGSGGRIDLDVGRSRSQNAVSFIPHAPLHSFSIGSVTVRLLRYLVTVHWRQSSFQCTLTFTHIHMSAEIRPIDPESVQRIVAGQAVFDLSTALKELVDNALDAKSRTINSKCRTVVPHTRTRSGESRRYVCPSLTAFLFVFFLFVTLRHCGTCSSPSVQSGH